MGESDRTGILGDLSRNLGALFRHLLPGVFIVGAAYIAHPRWFYGIDTKSWQHIAVVAATALATGNIWFAFNRYGIHQLIDYFAYLSNAQGPAPRSTRWHYVDDLGKYVSQSLRASHVPDVARQHVTFRASSVLLLYTVAEVGFLFGVWSEKGTFFDKHSTGLVVASLTTFGVGIWQNIITRRIDYYVLRSDDNQA